MYSFLFFILIFIIHSILYCTFYLIAHLTLFILLFVPFFILTYIYIYILLCYVSLFYCLCYFYFLFYYYYFFFFCTFHWADLSRPTFHYWLYPVWLCMWQIIKNLEPTFSCGLINLMCVLLEERHSCRFGTTCRWVKLNYPFNHPARFLMLDIQRSFCKRILNREPPPASRCGFMGALMRCY